MLKMSNTFTLSERESVFHTKIYPPLILDENVTCYWIKYC